MSSNETVAGIVYAREDELRLLHYEAAFAIDENGNVVLEKSAEPGTPYELAFTEDDIDRLKAASGVVFTHNHPRGWNYDASDPRRRGSSFSPEDILFACRAELWEMRAVTPALRFSLKPPEGNWTAELWQETLSLCVDIHNAQVRREFRRAIQDRRLDPREADVRHWDEVWTRVAAEIGLTYYREGEEKP